MSTEITVICCNLVGNCFAESAYIERCPSGHGPKIILEKKNTKCPDLVLACESYFNFVYMSFMYNLFGLIGWVKSIPDIARGCLYVLWCHSYNYETDLTLQPY